MDLRILPAGDAAMVVEFGDCIDEQINRNVQAYAAAVRQSHWKGVMDVVPTFRSLMICFDPLCQSYTGLKKKVMQMHISQETQSQSRKVWLVPCCYGREFGPDLPGMSKALGLSQKEIVQMHESVDYRIYMLGFLPGFVYLGGLPEQIAMPRLNEPRTSIPARSVGIGGSQTGVYPLASPGGWRLIGQTPLEFYDPSREEPVWCHAGEFLRFIAVSPHDYCSLRREVEQGGYQPEYLSVSV